LVVIVSNTAASYGLDLPRTRPNGPSGIDVTFQSASFDSLVAWLVALHDTYGVDVESASFSTAREPGRVNGQLSLHRL
jgi:type II secretory pathway component PulM